jgi:UDPglucose 6-dehydrogenase
MTVAIWGLAFKPDTDDMREAPSRVLIRALIDMGAKISVHDPIAMEEGKRAIALDFADNPTALQNIVYASSAESALCDATFLVISTEWKAYRSPDFNLIKSKLRYPVIFDGRNLYEPTDMKTLGIEYYGVGRRS